MSESAGALPWMLILFPVIAAVPLFLLVRYLRAKNQVANYDSRGHQKVAVACPSCQRAMAPGLALMGRGLIWRQPGQRGSGTFSLITQALPNTLSINLPPAFNRAWRCEGCEMAVIDHSEMVRMP